ncbi:hypothetical protein BH23GEM5_BH23GEM5_12330 [soil metagenome]
MKNVTHWLWLVVPIALAACGRDENVGQGGFMADTLAGAMGTSDVAVIMPPGDTGAAAGAAGGMQTVQFTPVGAGGHTGDVMLHAAGQQTEITVRLSGPQSGTHQGHIHSGRCPNPGGVVAPLEPITTDASGGGSSTSTVSVPMTTVMDGQHVVQYHTAGGDPGPPVVCASIPQAAI